MSHQVLIGPLNSEKHHEEGGGDKLPEKQDNPKHHVGLPADLLYIILQEHTHIFFLVIFLFYRIFTISILSSMPYNLLDE